MKQKQQKKKFLNALGEVRYARVVRGKRKGFLFLSAKANISARAECHNGGGQRRAGGVCPKSNPRVPKCDRRGPRHRGRACRILGVFEFNCLSGLGRHEAPAQRRARCGVPPNELNEQNSSMRSPVSPFAFETPSDISCRTATLHLHLMAKADNTPRAPPPKSLTAYVFSLHNAS